MPEDDYNDIEISDPHLLPEYVGDKLAVIDVKLRTKSRKIIQIEIQLEVTAALKSRIIFYSSKLITEQMGRGDNFGTINKVISIIITDEKLIKESTRYHHHFRFYDPDANVEFTDLIEIHTIELQKLPKETDGTQLYGWAKFIAAETEEELEMAVQANPQVRRAAIKLRELSADEKARDMLERREKGLWDMATFVAEAEQKGEQKARAEIARTLLAENAPIEQIVRVAKLTREEVEALSNQQG